MEDYIKDTRSKNVNTETFSEVSIGFDSWSLGLAIKHGMLRVMNELISAGFDPDTPCPVDSERLRPIHLACKYNRLDIILSLHRDHGIDIDSVNRYGDTALVYTLLHRSDNTIDVVKTLVEAGASVNICCLNGRTPLSAAISGKNIDVCRYLISKGADINARIKKKKNIDHMMHALKQRVSIAILRLLVEYVSDINAYDDKQTTILMYATNSNAGIDFIRLLLEYGADVIALDTNNTSALCYAIESRHYTMVNTMEKIVNLLVKFGADVNVLDNNLVSPLMHAVMDGANIGVVRLLVESGAVVNASDREKMSPLIHACASNGITTDVIEFLLDSGADVNVFDASKNSPLCYAIQRCHNIVGNNTMEKRVNLLVKFGADVNILDNNLISPLIHAVCSKRANIGLIRLLVESGADVNASDSEKMSPLIHACASTSNGITTDVIEFLLQSGADVNVLDASKNSPLCYATQRSFHIIDDNTMEKQVNLLVKFGADVNVLDNDLVSPLMHAVMDGANIGVVRLLVESGAVVNASDREEMFPLIHACASNGITTDVIEFLLDSGADVNVCDASKNSPLCYAIQRCHNIVGNNTMEKQVNLLVKFGADVNILDNNLVSPLMHAVRKRANIGLIRLLVESGAVVNASDREKMSPLIHACASNGITTDVIEFLLDSGADVNVLDTNKKSPVCYALENHDLEKLKVLVKSGANVNTLDRNQMSPLMYVLCHQDRYEIPLNVDSDIIQVLVDFGADVNIVDCNGYSTLMYALDNNAPVEVLLLFLESGVDVCARHWYNPLQCPLNTVLGNFDTYRSMKKKDGGCINIVQLFIESASDVKGLFATLPQTQDLHASFDAICALCSKDGDIGANDETDNTILHQVMTKISLCCCSKCFNLVHFLIVELNLSLWTRNRHNNTPFHCVLSGKEYGKVWEASFRREITGQILKLCLHVGYFPDSAEMRLVQGIERRYSVNITVCNVTSLQDICCFSVRRALGRRLPTAVNSLPIPEELKQRVKLTHLRPMDETPENTVTFQIQNIVRYFDEDDDDRWKEDEYEGSSYEMTDIEKEYLYDRYDIEF